MKRQLRTIQRDLGANLKAMRAKAGLSQEALALSADVDRTYVSQIERGIGNPSIRVLATLSNCLGTDICDLLEPQH